MPRKSWVLFPIFHTNVARLPPLCNALAQRGILRHLHLAFEVFL